MSYNYPVVFLKKIIWIRNRCLKSEGFPAPRDNISLKASFARDRGCSMDSDDRVLREEMLRREVLAGNEQAWRIWYGETFDGLYRYVLWRCGGRRDWADEIVQETWLWAVRRMRRFAPGQGSFLAWMRGIASNVIRNHFRSQKKLLKTRQPVDDADGKNGYAGSQRRAMKRRSKSPPCWMPCPTGTRPCCGRNIWTACRLPRLPRVGARPQRPSNRC